MRKVICNKRNECHIANCTPGGCLCATAHVLELNKCGHCIECKEAVCVDAPLKGLSVDVYRNNGCDCTNGGISYYFNKFILVGEGVPEIFEETEDTPAIILIERYLQFGSNSRTCGNYLNVGPDYDREKHSLHFMFGGNFIYTSDSRFPGIGPLPIHDRRER